MRVHHESAVEIFSVSVEVGAGAGAGSYCCRVSPLFACCFLLCDVLLTITLRAKNNIKAYLCSDPSIWPL